MSQISVNELNVIQNKINNNTEPLQMLVNSIVADHCKELDAYMRMVDEALCAERKPTTAMLEDMLLNINSLLYWAGNGLEQATVKESMAKMIKEEKFNLSYNGAEGTMGDKKATATLDSQKEELARLCYTNAVKLYQHKIDRASEMASSMKKIITHRISEMELSRMAV